MMTPRFLVVVALVLVVGSVIALQDNFNTNANSSFTVTHTSQSDFLGGTLSSSLDSSSSPGNITLMQGKNVNQKEISRGYSPLTNSIFSGDQVSLNQGYTYNILSSPPIGFNPVCHTFRDSVTGYLYVSECGGGLSVLDTDTESLIFHYSTTSSPALQSNIVKHSFRDSLTGYLYISTFSGLSVIDTTTNTLIARYYTGSTPSLANNNVSHAFRDPVTNYLYISTDGGLSVINTISNILVFRYHTASSPAIPSNIVYNSFRDPVSNRLFIGTSEGLVVMNTSPNSLVTTYDTNSNPALLDNYIFFSFRDPLTGYLNIGTNSGGLYVIDTDTDTLIARYHIGSSPALRNNTVRHAFRDTDSGYLFVATTGGLSIINTVTNSLVTDYSTHPVPLIANDLVYHSFIDPNSSDIILSTYGGVSVVNSDSSIVDEGEFYLQPESLNYRSGGVISWDGDPVALQYRTGGEAQFWMDEFDDDSTDNIHDPYLWGSQFGSIVEDEGVLSLSSPNSPTEAYALVDSGKSADFYPAGSVVQARLKLNIDLGNFDNFLGGLLFTDNMVDGSTSFTATDEWINIKFIPSLPFSRIGFRMLWDGTWGIEDSFQIDWISITQPNSNWSEWSDPCSDPSGCIVDPVDLEDGEWIQYRLGLEAINPYISPIVSDITITSGYHDSGEFISSVIDAGKVVKWDSLTSGNHSPTGTSIAFYTRTGPTSTPDDSWGDWDEVNSPISSPDNRYLQYKMVMSTTDDDITPLLDSVSVNYSLIPEPVEENTPPPSNPDPPKSTPKTTPQTSSPTTTVNTGHSEDEEDTDKPQLKLKSIGNELYVDGVRTYKLSDGSSVRFIGNTAPFSRVNIDIDETDLGCSITADQNGNFECTIRDIPEGSHKVTVVSQNSDGSSTTLPIFTLIIEEEELIPTTNIPVASQPPVESESKSLGLWWIPIGILIILSGSVLVFLIWRIVKMGRRSDLSV